MFHIFNRPGGQTNEKKFMANNKEPKLDDLYMNFVPKPKEVEVKVIKPRGRPKKEKKPRGRPRKYIYEVDSFTAALKRYQESHPLVTITNNIKARCKKHGIVYDLDIDHVFIPKTCPILNIELTSEKGRGILDNSISIDRKDPTKGYTMDNIQVISMLANRMKQNASPEQLLAFAEWINKTYKK